MANSNSLTPEEKSEMMQYLQQEGSDFSPAYINPQKQDWDKIKVPVIDERTPENPKACSLDLKSVLDIYGIEVRQVAEQVEKHVSDIAQAEIRISEKEKGINAVELRLTGPDGAESRIKLAEKNVNDAELRITGPGGAEERMTTLESNTTTAAGQVAKDLETVTAVKGDVLLSQQTVNEDKQAVSLMKADVERIYQDAHEGGIYGVDFNMVTGEAKRIDASVGLEFHKFIGGTGSSPVTAKSFMSVGPWANIYQTLRTVDGNNLVARTGDANFEAALRGGECNAYTCIPKYYVKTETPMINGQSHWLIHVSAKPFAGAISISGDDVEIADFVTGEKNGKHVSMPNVEPKIYTTLTTFEAKAAAQGLYNNSDRDFLAWWLLLLVQTASLNSQNSVGAGVSSGFPYSSSADYKCQEPTTNEHTVIVKSTGWKVGMTAYVATAYYENNIRVGNVIAVEKHPNGIWTVLTLDGDPFSTTTESWCTCHGQRVSVDAYLGMGLNCGYYQTEGFSESQCHAFVYGIADPWGNVFQCMSGMAKYNDKLYIATGRELTPSADQLPSAGWHEADDFAWLGEGWPSEWRIKQTVNSISFVVTKLGGNNAMLFGDYMWGAADNIRIPWRGGCWYYGPRDGARCVSWLAASYSNLSYGGRLTYQKAS